MTAPLVEEVAVVEVEDVVVVEAVEEVEDVEEEEAVIVIRNYALQYMYVIDP